MKNNTQVETAQKGQATNKIQSENTQKDKTPISKIILMKETESRKKAREEQYRIFRINALRRRCNRMGIDKDKTEELVKKLIEQMNAPKNYNIIVMLNGDDGKMFKEALAKEKVVYKLEGAPHTKKESIPFLMFEGDQKVLAKLREIAPPGAKVWPYAKKADSVLSDIQKEVIKKPSNNTAEAKKNAKTVHKKINKKRSTHKSNKGKFFAKKNRRKTLLELKNKRKATTVQLNSKTRSKGSKKASTNLKKAA